MKRGVWFKSLRVLGVLGAATAAALALLVFRPQAERHQPIDATPLVDVVPAVSRNIRMVVEGYGTVAARHILILVAEVPGQITLLHPALKAGNSITAQSLLIEIDPRPYRLEVARREVQIRQARAAVKRIDQEVRNLHNRIDIARADVELAETEFSRVKTLSQKNVVSKSQRDQTEQRYLQSLERLRNLENQLALTGPTREELTAQLDMAGVMLKQARLDLEKTQIRLPFDGWILEKNIEAGQHVTIGQPLAKAYRVGGLDIEVPLPAGEIRWLPERFDAASGPPAQISLPENKPSPTWRGHLTRLKAQVDAETRTLTAVVEVESPMSTAADGQGATNAAENRSKPVRLRPGMFVGVRIQGDLVQNVFVLPRHLVAADETVSIYENNRLRIRPVKVLRTYRDTVIVAGGIENGDRIIQTPLSSPVDGMRVRTP